MGGSKEILGGGILFSGEGGGKEGENESLGMEIKKMWGAK